MAITTFSLTNGGTSEKMITADCDRTALIIQPQTENTLVQFGQTAGLQASGALTVAVNPTNTETIAINGVTFTFVSSGASSTNVVIGVDAATTAKNLADTLNASTNPSILLATYADNGAGVVTITAVAGGTDGNAYTLAVSSGGHVTRSGATLSGGSNTVGGLLLVTTQLTPLTLDLYPDIVKDVYVVSPTNAAYTNYGTSTRKIG